MDEDPFNQLAECFCKRLGGLSEGDPAEAAEAAKVATAWLAFDVGASFPEGGGLVLPDAPLYRGHHGPGQDEWAALRRWVGGQVQAFECGGAPLAPFCPPRAECGDKPPSSNILNFIQQLVQQKPDALKYLSWAAKGGKGELHLQMVLFGEGDDGPRLRAELIARFDREGLPAAGAWGE
jgi:hypothetical protein